VKSETISTIWRGIGILPSYNYVSGTEMLSTTQKPSLPSLLHFQLKCVEKYSLFYYLNYGLYSSFIKIIGHGKCHPFVLQF
jgi:hypothetical protein